MVDDWADLTCGNHLYNQHQPRGPCGNKNDENKAKCSFLFIFFSFLTQQNVNKHAGSSCEFKMEAWISVGGHSLSQNPLIQPSALAPVASNKCPCYIATQLALGTCSCQQHREVTWRDKDTTLAVMMNRVALVCWWAPTNRSPLGSCLQHWGWAKSDMRNKKKNRHGTILF